MQNSPVSGFSVNGSPGLTRAQQESLMKSQQGSPGTTRAQQGSPGFTRARQDSPGLIRAQQGSPSLTRAQQGSPIVQAKLQGSPSMTAGPQGSFGEKLTRKGKHGESGNSRVGGAGSRRDHQQRWVFFTEWKLLLMSYFRRWRGEGGSSDGYWKCCHEGLRTNIGTILTNIVSLGVAYLPILRCFDQPNDIPTISTTI